MMMHEAPKWDWDIDAEIKMIEERIGLTRARNKVILEWLKKGKLEPFADWVLGGHTPSKDVLNALAVMGWRGADGKFLPSAQQSPEGQRFMREFRGKIIVQPGAKPSNPYIKARDSVLTRYIRLLHADRVDLDGTYRQGLKLEQAIAQATEMHNLRSPSDQLAEDTVRDIYKQNSRGKFS